MNLAEQRAQQLFQEAIKRSSPAEISAFLDQTCAGDESLRHEVESLLAAHRSAGDFLAISNRPKPTGDTTL